MVDDGSSDDTCDYVSALATTENRLRLLRRERKPAGASACRNIGTDAATGEYVLFLDSDDLLAPTCLEERVKFMEQNPSLDFAVFVMKLFRSKPGDSPRLINNFTDEDDLDRFLRQDVPWQTTGPLWRKASLRKVGPWDEKALSMQDWEFHVRALATGLIYRKEPIIDSYWRVTGTSSITHRSSWGSPRRIWNRIRLFMRIAAILRSRGLLTPRRRRLLAVEYYRHAFEYNGNRKLALKIWSVAKREEMIGALAFSAGVGGDLMGRLVQRAKILVMACLIPEIKLVKTHFLATLPVVRPSKFQDDSRTRPP